MKLRATQPAPLEALPEQDRVHLPSELINPPHAVVLNHFAGRIEREAVQPAKGVDFIPVLTDLAIFEGDVVRPVPVANLIRLAMSCESGEASAR